MIPLLDSGVLIALCLPDHEHHGYALRWFAGHPSFAVCPITEGALVRYLVRSSSEGIGTVRPTLAILKTYAGYAFWPDDLSYESIFLDRIRGHKQVTDAYLVSLASARQSRLVTFDKALAAVHPEAILIPTT